MRRSNTVSMVGAFLILLSLTLAVPMAQAAEKDYPRKPITMVMPFPAGSATGISAQQLAGIITQKKFLPHPIQVVFKPGGAGSIGTAEALQGKPDGYTLVYSATAPILIHPLVKDLPYSHRSLIPIIQTLRSSWILSVRNDSPWKNVQEFFEYAKQHPGEVTVGSAGDYSWGHVGLLQIMKATGLKFRHIPFEGSQPNVTALLGGHIRASMTISGDVTKQVSAGKVRVLATVEAERTPYYPDAPAIRELGYDVAGTMFTNIVIAPKGTPEAVVVTLHDAFKKALETPEWADFIKKVGASPGYIGYRDLPPILEKYVKETAALLEAIGVKVRKIE
ncbi:MAG: hypothetical protein A3K30_03660 [Deltaproteobacteria bacterium RBG_13_51_10]|nr:MAG: hypothetical protein A3K30_03660 [Deltaproteobacteria bacterium RBG_13_51_10]